MNKRWLAAIVLVTVAGVGFWFEPTGSVRGWLRGEAQFEGRFTSYWARQIVSGDPVTQEETRARLVEGGAAAVPTLVELLAWSDDDPWQTAEIRWRAAEVLGLVGPQAKAAIPALLSAADDKDAHVRNVVANALPAVGVPAEQAVPKLIQLLDSESRREASRALSQYGPEAAAAIDPLIDVLRNPSLGSEVRWNAARTLGKIRAPAVSAIPVLVEHLSDAAPTVREHCAEALGDIGPGAAEAVPALVNALRDAATRVRRDAARSLGQIGASPTLAVPALLPLLNDEEEIVREAARTALKRLDPDTDYDTKG